MWNWLSKIDPNSVFVVGSAAAMFVYHRIRPKAVVRYLSLDDAKRFAAGVYRLYRLEADALREISHGVGGVDSLRHVALEQAQALALDAVKRRAALAGQTISDAWLADIKASLK